MKTFLFRSLLVVGLLAGGLATISLANAQIAPIKSINAVEISAEIPEFVPQKEPFTLDASGSKVLSNSGSASRFIWVFENGKKTKFGPKVTYAFSKPGTFPVELQIRQGGHTTTKRYEITSFVSQGVLISEDLAESTELIEQAAQKGIWLKPLPFEKLSQGIAAESQLGKLLSQNIGFIQDSDWVFFQDESGSALQNFLKWGLSQDAIKLSKKILVALTKGSLPQMKKIIQPSIKNSSVEYLFVSSFSAVNTILSSNVAPEIVKKLDSRGIFYELADQRANDSPFLLFSKITTYLVSYGLSQNILYLILCVPIITFIIAFARQFIGLSTFGVFSPLMVTLTFLLIGLKVGLFVFLGVMILSTIFRGIFNRVELLYIPRVCLLLAVISLSFLGMLGLLLYFNTSLDLALAVFPMMILATFSEKFMAVKTQEGILNAFLSISETVLVSLVAFAFVNWSSVESLLLSIPELIIIPLILTVWLGKFTGLKVTEYFKFWTLIHGTKNKEEEE